METCTHIIMQILHKLQKLLLRMFWLQLCHNTHLTLKLLILYIIHNRLQTVPRILMQDLHSLPNPILQHLGEDQIGHRVEDRVGVLDQSFEQVCQVALHGRAELERVLVIEFSGVLEDVFAESHPEKDVDEASSVGVFNVDLHAWL